MDSQKLKSILMKGAVSVFLILVCGPVVSEGVRSIDDFFAIRLMKLPGLGFLGGWEGWHRLDLANIAALGLVALESQVLIRSARYLLVPGTMRDDHPDWSSFNERTLVWVGFCFLTGVQAALFFLGILSDEDWSFGGGILRVLKALVGSVMYLGAMVGASYLVVRLESHNW